MITSSLICFGHEIVSFAVSDPSLPDNPLVFVSKGFCDLTGYAFDEVVGKNCRFLQGTETKKEDVDRIRKSLKEEKDCSVNVLNHKKDGSTFINEVRIPCGTEMLPCVLLLLCYDALTICWLCTQIIDSKVLSDSTTNTIKRVSLLYWNTGSG